MRKKFNKLSLCCLILALAIFVFSFVIYHYLAPGGMGFTSVFQTEPAKPFVTNLFGIWGVCFLFASVFCRLIAVIFYPKEK